MSDSDKDHIEYMKALFHNDGLSFEQFLEQRNRERAEEARLKKCAMQYRAKKERRLKRKKKLRSLIKWR